MRFHSSHIGWLSLQTDGRGYGGYGGGYGGYGGGYGRSMSYGGMGGMWY